MNASIILKIKSSDYLPAASATELVTWLETHGVPPAETTVEVVAELATWAAVGADVKVDGTVVVSTYSYAWSALAHIANDRLGAGQRDVQLRDADVASVVAGLQARRAKEDADLQARRAEEAAAGAAKRAADERAAEKYRAAGIDGLLMRCDNGKWDDTYGRDSCEVNRLVFMALGDDAYKRAQSEANVRNAREAIEREASAGDMRAWVVAQEAGFSAEIVRAAGEGRKISDQLARVVVDWISAELESMPEVKARVRSYATEERDDVPSAEAYALYDALVAAKDSLASAAKLPGAVIEIGPISRFDIDSRQEETWRTGAKVKLTHRWLEKAWQWTVLAEPAGLDQDDEDD